MPRSCTRDETTPHCFVGQTFELEGFGCGFQKTTCGMGSCGASLSLIPRTLYVRNLTEIGSPVKERCEIVQTKGGC